MRSDPLGVLATTRPVVETARSVSIVAEAVERTADELARTPFQAPSWRVWPHFWNEAERTATYVLLLDALNFCFWGEPRWRVAYAGQSLDGYWALAAALRRAIDAGEPVLEADFLAEMDRPRLEWLLRGEGALQLMDARLRHVQEVGRVLGARYAGSFLRFIQAQGQGSATRLVRALVRDFPSFDDVAAYGGRPVRFYKRAQLLASDLHGAFGGQGPGALAELDQLTAFADYKLPQVLRGLGLLAYQPELAATIDTLQPLQPGSPEEVEIRAATVWAVELLRRALAARGLRLRAFELDWYLWSLGQGRQWPHPYHRTLTTAY